MTCDTISECVFLPLYLLLRFTSPTRTSEKPCQVDLAQIQSYNLKILSLQHGQNLTFVTSVDLEDIDLGQ